MDYDDIREQLLELNNLKLPPDREQKIRFALRAEMEGRRLNHSAFPPSRRWTRQRIATIAGTAAAVVIVAAAVGVGTGQFGTSSHKLTKGFTTLSTTTYGQATNGPATNGPIGKSANGLSLIHI